MGMEQRDIILLTKYENNLTTTLNLGYLIPHLKECKLLADNEADHLNKKLDKDNSTSMQLTSSRQPSRPSSRQSSRRSSLAKQSISQQTDCDARVEVQADADFTHLINQDTPFPPKVSSELSISQVSSRISSRTDRDFYLEVLNNCDRDLITTLNLTFLLPYLNECKLLANEEVASLSKCDQTTPRARSEVNKRFLDILKSKGSRAFSLFLNALQKEDQHIGHKDLYDLLHKENLSTPDLPYDCSQESVGSEYYPTALVVPNTGNKSMPQSQKSSASDISSPITSSNEALISNSLISVQQQLRTIENHIVDVKKILSSSSSGISSASDDISSGISSASDNISSGISSASDDISQRTSIGGCNDGKQMIDAKPLRKSDTYPSLKLVCVFQHHAVHV